MSVDNTQITKTYNKTKLESNKYNFSAKIECENVESIIAISCKPTIKAYEAISEKVSLAGVARIEVVYTNSTGSISTTYKYVDFAPQLELSFADKYLFEATEKETTAKQLSGNEVLVSSVFEISAEGLLSLEIAKPNFEGEDVFKLTKTIEAQTISAIAEDKIVLTDESEISASQILKCEAICLPTKVQAAEDAVVVDGELLVWICSELEGTFKNTFKRIEFSNEVSAIGAKSDNMCDYNLQIETCIASLSNEGTNATLGITSTLRFSGIALAKAQVEVLDDIYSTSQELKVSTTGLALEQFDGKTYDEQSFSATLSTKDKNINMGSILAVVSPMYVAEGIKPSIECTILYRHAETDKIESTILSCSAPELKETPSIVIKSFNKKKAKEVDVDFSIVSIKRTTTDDFVTFVSEIEEGAKIEPDNKAIVVYQAKKGQSLFDVAKALKTAPTTLLSQNSELTDVFATDQKVVLYRRTQTIL